LFYNNKFLFIKEFQFIIFRKKFFQEFFFKFLKNTILFKLKKLKFRFQFNKLKFQEIYIYKLSELIHKIYNKKLEFKIINLKSVIIHSDLFTEILTLKLKKKGTNVNKNMSYVLNLARIPKVFFVRREILLKQNFKEKKINTLNISALFKLKSFEKILKLFYKNIINWNNNINLLSLFQNTFNLIKYKSIGGIKLEVKGRLSKRYRADRSIHKLKWKGGLKNLDSSYNGISSLQLRGNLNSNVEYSIFTSKRRIGAFAVKGWVTGK
jgi:hypothetical protein